MDIFEYLGFWDWAFIIYLVGIVLAFVLIHDRLCKPECYRIPLALFFALWWPLLLVLVVGIIAIVFVEDVLNAIRNFILAGRE
jgi:hypothetical protein